MSRQQDVLYNIYRAGYLTKAEYEEYKAYDVSQDFIQPESTTTSEHDFLYYAVLEEAQDIMYDYLVEQNGVSEQELKMIQRRNLTKNLALEALQQGGIPLKQRLIKML